MSQYPVLKSYVRTRRGDVHVHACGEGPRPILLLHAVSTGGMGYEYMMPILAARGYRTVAVDLMGYGRSDKRDAGPWLMSDFADSVMETALKLGIEPTFLVAGHFSALVAIEVAARSAAVTKALVIDGVPYMDAERRAAARVAPPQASVEWNIDGRHALEYWKTCHRILSRVDPTLTMKPNPSVDFRRHYIALLETFLFEPNTMNALASFEIEQRCRTVMAQALIVSGDHDWNLPNVEPVRALLARSKAHIFSGVHPLHQIHRPERALEYADLLSDFLAGVA